MDDVDRRRPPGRRTGESGTREAILDAARTRFADHGFDGASLRAIASAAGVDPALIRHFFGDKETLFITAMAARSQIPARLAEAAGTDGPDAGRTFADAYLRLWDDAEIRPVLLALARSALTSAPATRLLRETFVSRVLAQAAPDADRLPQVALAMSHLFGLAIARHIVGLPPIVELSHDELVDQVAPTIQRYLTGTHR